MRNRRLILISHAATPAMREGRFPADDPLDARGVAAAAAWTAWRERASSDADTLALSSPAVCALDTARAMGLTVGTATELADADYGEWRGLRMAEMTGEVRVQVEAWTRDPDCTPPNGESFEQVRARVGRWLDTLDTVDAPRDVIAVTHACVIRAAVLHALGAPSSSFNRVEVAPLSVVELRRSGRGWAWLAAREC